MQITRIYRRGIVRPLDNFAFRQLDSFWVQTPVRAEWIPIEDDLHFDAIWQSGIFQSINESCDIEISSYEEVVLEVDKLKLALDALPIWPIDEESIVAIFGNMLRGAIADAIETEMPLYFIL